MKKSILILGTILLSVTSCTTIVKTSKTADSPTSLLSATVADLQTVTAERVSYTMTPTAEVRRGGSANVRRAAENEMLQKFNADVLLEAQYVTTKKWTLFGTKIESITISGRPAKYNNFHSLNDSVWCNPTFRDNYENDAKKNEGILIKIF